MNLGSNVKSKTDAQLKKLTIISALLLAAVFMLASIVPAVAGERVGNLPYPSISKASTDSTKNIVTTNGVSSNTSDEGGIVTDDLTTLTTDKATALATALVGKGSGVTISNAKLTCKDVASGKFTVDNNIIGFTSGIILSSGDIKNVIGPNTSTGISTSNSTAGDADLTTLAKQTTYDACVLEFDFVPKDSTISFNYVFASDEYNEWINSYNDVFGFFVNGTNCAVVGANNDPVSINTINGGKPFDPTGAAGVNQTLFNNNDDQSIDIEMDGFTDVLTCKSNVTANATNHMKLAIADAGDSALDSNVFIWTGTFLSGTKGVAVDPSEFSQTDIPGADVSYDLLVKNLGSDSDSYTVTFTGNKWATTVSATTLGPIAAADSMYLNVSVTIPSTATSSDSDSVTVTITSASDSTKYATSVLTTKVEAQDCKSVATHTLPAYYIPGFSVPVVIYAKPCPGTTSYGVEDELPAGWTASDMNNDGTYDSANNKVKWGPWFDNEMRVLTYTATSPALASGVKCGDAASDAIFIGTQSVDGVDGFIGADGKDKITCNTGNHPADTNKDNKIKISEVTSYATAWKLGKTWPTWNPITIDFLTRAIYLWKSGETYHFDSTQTPPLSWMTGAAAVSSYGDDIISKSTSTPGAATRSLSSNNYTVGTAITVTIAVSPTPTTVSYAISETIPDGWTVDSNSITGGGVYAQDKVELKYKINWVCLTGCNADATLTYKMTPPTGTTGTKTLTGSASFDGTKSDIAGSSSLTDDNCTYVLKPTSNSKVPAKGGSVKFAITATGTDCKPSAATAESWITVPTSITLKKNKGTVTLTVDANTTAATKTGTVTIKDQDFEITQLGVPCKITSIDPTKNLTVTNAGVTNSTITVVAPTGCSWTATADTKTTAAAVTISSGATGSGNGTITYSVGANSSGKAKTSKITIKPSGKPGTPKIFNIKQAK